MSHELRTPLNAIMGYAQTLKMSRGEDRTLVEGLDIIHQGGRHLLVLINDILDLTKIEAGRLALRSGPVFFPSFINGIHNIVTSRAKTKSLAFSCKLAESVPQGIIADEARLRQIILNLLDNAIKFTETGEVSLCLSPIDRGGASNPQGPESGFRLRIEILDTGCGIAADQLERIFQPFEQVNQNRAQNEGTGLGLSISRQLVRLMGSELQVESQPGKGSRFWFDLGVTALNDPIEPVQEEAQKIIGYQGRRRRVLVVDDIDSNRMLMVDLLSPLGFEIWEAQDGFEAIVKARELVPDLILIDRRMPGLDGYEAARRIRQIPNLHRTIVIAMSASVFPESQVDSRAAGIDDFLLKPIEWPILTHLLKVHLDLKWIYEDTGDKTGTAFSTTMDKMHTPSAEMLKELLELTRMGKVTRFTEHIEQIKRDNSQYSEFADILICLAQRYEIKGIQTILDKLLKKSGQ
jgi:CheY-like chemotaxis protein